MSRPTRLLKIFFNSNRGSFTIELALVFPVLILMLFFCVDLFSRVSTVGDLQKHSYAIANILANHEYVYKDSGSKPANFTHMDAQNLYLNALNMLRKDGHQVAIKYGAKREVGGGKLSMTIRIVQPNSPPTIINFDPGPAGSTDRIYDYHKWQDLSKMTGCPQGDMSKSYKYQETVLSKEVSLYQVDLCYTGGKIFLIDFLVNQG
ncbi:tight adherence pilus pseudopilin TadF [Dongshaea marina]|uniref:tight adherence pilus pseudopilin TadF n=1 Tax=Dongshaea marina TaxID=2047966 RepID=UPI000D3E4120|nr:tight adherence pilus pseudopilin TadF [Dongshaea marina]